MAYSETKKLGRRKLEQAARGFDKMANRQYMFEQIVLKLLERDGLVASVLDGQIVVGPKPVEPAESELEVRVVEDEPSESPAQ